MLKHILIFHLFRSEVLIVHRFTLVPPICLCCSVLRKTLLLPWYPICLHCLVLRKTLHSITVCICVFCVIVKYAAIVSLTGIKSLVFVAEPYYVFRDLKFLQQLLLGLLSSCMGCCLLWQMGLSIALVATYQTTWQHIPGGCYYAILQNFAVMYPSQLTSWQYHMHTCIHYIPWIQSQLKITEGCGTSYKSTKYICKVN